MHIDLSVPINDQTPIYPGDPATKIEPAGVMESDGYTDHYISMGTHVGTHIDAPAHMVPSGATLDKIPIEQFIGRGCYIKIDNKVFDFEKIKKADIREGDIVLFHTGLSDVYYEDAYFEEYPALSDEIAKYLVEKGIKMVGFDMCSPDHEEFTAHRTLLGGGVLIVENLTNLGKLADKSFTVYALPINLQIDGAPARVVAKVE